MARRRRWAAALRLLALSLLAWRRGAEGTVAAPGFQNRYYQVFGYNGSRVLEFAQPGRFASYVEVTWSQSVAVDALDRVWIADATYHQVVLLHDRTRYIDFQAYFVSYAGVRERPGFFDGSRLKARFDSPMGIAVTWDLNSQFKIFIADTNNHCIRRVTYDTGRVATIVGSPLVPGLRDGPGKKSRFRFPMSLGVDYSAQNLFALDNQRRIRWIDLRGDLAMVTTLVSGACRPVSQWTIVASIVLRGVGCHPDWSARESGDTEVELFEPEFTCLGHTATCAPRDHPAIADRRSMMLEHVPPETPTEASAAGRAAGLERLAEREAAAIAAGFSGPS